MVPMAVPDRPGLAATGLVVASIGVAVLALPWDTQGVIGGALVAAGILLFVRGHFPGLAYAVFRWPDPVSFDATVSNGTVFASGRDVI
jgi:hypothetical protein